MKFIERWVENYKEWILLKEVSTGNNEAFAKLYQQYSEIFFLLAKANDLPDDMARSLQAEFHSKLWDNRFVLNRGRTFDLLLNNSVKDVLRCILEYRSGERK